MFPGLGPIGCTPLQRSKSQKQECSEEISNWAAMYNEVLKSMLSALKGELKGISYSYFDTYHVMLNAINNPASYGTVILLKLFFFYSFSYSWIWNKRVMIFISGFTQVKSACCGIGKLKADVPCVPISTYCSNRSDHIFWDFVHPTQALTRIFVDTIFDGPSQYTFPMNVRHLISV